MKPKVTEISERMFEVLGHNVIFQKKKGRVILLCSCQNSARFTDNNFCYHKQLVLEYINLKPIKEKINELINNYETFSKVDKNYWGFLDELKNLKRIIEK